MAEPVARPNHELVVYALYLSGGDTHRVHTEDVAIRCFELFPDSFSWARHPELPDKDIVRVALTDARKERHGSLVDGRAGQRHGLMAKTQRRPVEDGWSLTERGIEWVHRNLPALEQLAGARVVKAHRQKLLRDLERIRRHRLFEQYLDSPQRFVPTIGDIADMLRCRVDAEPEIWQGRFEKVRRQAESASQEDVLDFISKCEEATRSQ